MASATSQRDHEPVGSFWISEEADVQRFGESHEIDGIPADADALTECTRIGHVSVAGVIKCQECTHQGGRLEQLLAALAGEQSSPTQKSDSTTVLMLFAAKCSRHRALFASIDRGTPPLPWIRATFYRSSIVP
jgi:hypothetical protein